MAPDHVVGWGELKSGSCPPTYAAVGGRHHKLKRRGAVHGHSVSGAAAAMPLFLSSKSLWPLLPSGHLRAVSSQRLPLLLQEHPVGTWLPEPGRAGITLVMLWDGQQEMPAAQQHNPTKASFSTPSLTDALSWSPDTSPRWSDST